MASDDKLTPTAKAEMEPLWHGAYCVPCQECLEYVIVVLPCQKCGKNAGLTFEAGRRGKMHLCVSCIGWMVDHLLFEIREWSSDERVDELLGELEVEWATQ